MGCGSSKRLEDERVVFLLLQRTKLLAEAISLRYALADAHLDYSRSLRSLAAALQEFLLPLAPHSPVLNLTSARKGDPSPTLPRSAAPLAPATAHAHSHSHSHSHSGSHIKFHDDDDGDDDDISPLHSDSSSPVRDHHLPPEMDDFPANPSSFVNLSYSRNQPAAPSVSYEQRPQIPETVQFGAGATAAAYPYYSAAPPYPVESSNLYSYPYPYMPYGGGMGGSVPFYGAASPPPSFPMTAGDVRGSPSTSRAPPAPPSPPTTSTWDFLNPFDSFDDYYAPYSPNRSLKDVREEEGIPDLEEDQEVVKEAYGVQKSSPSTSARAAGMAAKEDEIRSLGEDLPRKSKDTTSSISEHEVPVVEKSVVSEQEQDTRSLAGFTAPSRTYNNISEIVQEIRAQFNRASESAEQVAKVLEVGKRPYHHKSSVLSWICGLPSLPISENDEPLIFEEQKVNLSSTLQKLYMWEKKLLEEVKAEEKLRLLYDRKCEQLNDFKDRGAESEKIEALQTFIRKLSTKIKIEIQIVNTISNNIHKLRDQELWPQINELVQGFLNMWKDMLECHHIQFQAISQAKSLDLVVSSSKQMEAAKHLELELLNCVGNFSLWATTQRSYVKKLNEWLVKGLHYEPEETDDGPVPFSPGRLGAPPVFVICNHWSQIMDRISEKDVVTSMQTFADIVWGLLEKHNFQQRQSLMANRDMDGKLRLMERDQQVIQKAREAQTRKLMSSDQGHITISKQVVHQDAADDLGNMQSSLKQVFETMENFTTSSSKAYEELLARCQEVQRLTRDTGRIS